jgi:hypothetical protein
MAFLRCAGKARKLFCEELKKERFLDRVPEKSFGTPPERARYEKMEFSGIYPFQEVLTADWRRYWPCLGGQLQRALPLWL